MKLKVKLVIILLALVIYFVLNFVYISLFKVNDVSNVYILNQQVKKGEEIDINKLKKAEVVNASKDDLLELEKVAHSVFIHDFNSRNNCYK